MGTGMDLRQGTDVGMEVHREMGAGMGLGTAAVTTKMGTAVEVAVAIKMGEVTAWVARARNETCLIESSVCARTKR